MSLTKVPITAAGSGPSRYVLVRRNSTQPPTRVRIWYHGGGQAPGASAHQASLIPGIAETLDLFGEGTFHEAGPNSPDGNTGWILPDGTVPAGFTGTEDVVYTNAVLDWVRANYPGLPIYAGGYSSGGQGWMDWVHLDLIDLTGIEGWFVAKNTPMLGELTEEPLVTDKQFSATVLPPRFALWLANGDLTAHQERPHLTFDETDQVWANTYPDPVTSHGLLHAGPKGGQLVDVYRGETLFRARERHGSHTSDVWASMGNTIDRFFAEGATAPLADERVADQGSILGVTTVRR